MLPTGFCNHFSATKIYNVAIMNDGLLRIVEDKILSWNAWSLLTSEYIYSAKDQIVNVEHCWIFWSCKCIRHQLLGGGGVPLPGLENSETLIAPKTISKRNKRQNMKQYIELKLGRMPSDTTLPANTLLDKIYVFHMNSLLRKLRHDISRIDFCTDLARNKTCTCEFIVFCV